MKKKGYSLRRAVSILLALAMILTAAPQTGMTVLAVGEGTDTSQSIAADTDTTPAFYEDEADNGTDDAVTDRTGDEDDKKEGDIEDDDPSDKPEGEGDNQPADPDDGDQGGDDANHGEGNNTEEPAEPGEDTDDDLLTEEESVSANDVDALGADAPMAIDEEAPAYLGEVKSEEDGSRLVFNEWEWNEKKEGWGEDEPKTFKAAVLAALDYYAERGDQFEHVQIDEQAAEGANKNSDSALTVSKDYINKVISVLPEDGEGEFYYSYDFNDGINIGFSLWHPHETSNDFTAAYRVELLRNRGVKINLSNTGYPAEGLYVNWDGSAVERDKFDTSNIYNCFWGDGYPLALLSWGNNQPTGIVGTYDLNMEFREETWDDADYFCPYIGFSVDQAMNPEFGESFTAGKDYLITNLYCDEETAPLGETKTLTAGMRGDPERMSELVWGSLSDNISVKVTNQGSKFADLTALDFGDAYYWLKYNNNSNTYLELHMVRPAAVLDNGTKLTYVGDVIDDTFDPDAGEMSGKQYRRLRIEEWKVQEHKENIVDILKYYAQQKKFFNCIELNLIDSSSRTIKKDYINNAVAIMDDHNNDGEEVGKWMDYNFWNDATESGVNFTLSYPTETKADVKATFTLTELAGQGLKVKFASTAFPAESVSMDYSLQGEKYTGSMPFEEAEFRLFKHSSGAPTALVETNQEQGYGYYHFYGDGTNLHFNNIKPLGATEYLITSVYWDEEGERPKVGAETPLKAGTRAGTDEGLSSVTWKSFDTDKATIDKNGVMTAWREDEEIYYYVMYKVGKVQYLEVHGTHAVSQDVRIVLDKSEITLNYYEPGNDRPQSDEAWLQVRYYPVNVDRNNERIKWERITQTRSDGKSGNVVSVSADGGIRAEGPGTATVKVSYMDGVYDDEGNFTVSQTVLASAACEVTVVQPLMHYDMQDKQEKLDIYAVMDVDAALKDATVLNDDDDWKNDKWEWLDPETKLAGYKGMDGCQFPAKYKGDDGRTYTTFLWVNFITPTGITMMAKNKNDKPEDGELEWGEWFIPSYLVEGDDITFTYQYTLDGIDMYNPEQQGKVEAIQEKLKDYYANVEWTPPSKESFEEQDDEQVDEHKYIAKILGTGAKRKAEKKTFTVSVKNDNNKVVYKDTRNITVTLEPEYDFDSKVELVDPTNKIDEKGQRWLVVKVNGTDVDEYNNEKLTIASEDTAVLKLNANKTVISDIEDVNDISKGKHEDGGEDGTTYVKIPFTLVKPGTAWIKLTASDEMKTIRRYRIEFPDKEPKAVSPTTVTINKALANEDDRTAVVSVRTHEEYPLITEGDVDNNIKFLVDNKENDADFKVTAGQKGEDNVYDITIKLSEGSTLKKGKHTVTLNLYVKDQDEESQEETVKKPDGQIKVTVNVTETVPKVTFKQTKKYNNFYTDEEGYGILTVTTADGTEVKDLELVDPNAKTKCNFTLEPISDEPGENTYYIVLREGEDEEIIDYTKNTKGVLQYRLEGYDSEDSEPRTANLTVSAENKKPTIVLSAKSDTLYPNVYYMSSFIQMTDKATGDSIFNAEDGNEVRYVINAKTKDYGEVPVVEEADWENHAGEYVATLNNSYYLSVNYWGGINSILVEQPDLKDYKTKADKITLEIKKENWNDWVSVPYSITVNTGSPKLVLGASTVTLNKNSEVYQTQQAMTSLRLKGCQSIVSYDEWNWVRFTGQDDKSKKVLSGDGSLTLDYWNWWNEDIFKQYGDVIVRFNDNNVAAGSYKFKIEVGLFGDEQAYASTTLTVKVVDTAVTKCLNITAKGSIDAMDRDGTSVTYTPKLSNLSGTVCDGHLEGPDADLFESYWDGSKLVVQARPGENYSTKLSYKVRPVFNVDAESYGGYEVDAGKDLAIKVKQGKPKLTATMVNNTIYRQLGNTAEIRLSAIFNKKPVEIQRVELVNYTGDFNWLEDGDFYYDEESGTETVHLSLINDDRPDSIIKSGTYNVKLRVIYSEKAGNEKAAEVTCSIVVK